MAMTGMELLKAALAILGKDTAATADYETTALIHINSLLADLFDVNNAMRTANSEEMFTEIQILTLGEGEDLSDVEIPYEDIVARNVMPWGLARLIGLGESYRNIGYIANTYEENKLRASVLNDGAVFDAYSDSENVDEEEA